MNEQELTPEQEAEVSRMLAESAPPVAMPASVVARLDAVLADLVAEQESPVAAATADDGVVVQLKRRRWPQVLVAAAAVSLFGYVGGTLLLQDRGSSDDGGAAVGTADAESALPEPRRAAPQAVPKPLAPAEQGDGRETDPTAADSLSGLLEGDALRLTRDAADATLALDKRFGAATDLRSYATKAGRCSSPVLRPSETTFELPLEGGRRAVVVLSPVGGGTQATVYPCRQSRFPIGSSLVLAAR